MQKIFLFGIDNAGKTSLSQALRTGKANPDNQPTKAFDVTDMILKDFEKKVDFKIWDAPGQTSFRKIWGRGMDSANIMVFVLDTADKNRFQEAKQVLLQGINDLETRNVPLMFLFHKMDLAAAKENLKTAEAVFRPALMSDRKTYLLQTSVNLPESVEQVKKTIGQIVQESRWG
jgi:ADP-ribosylation factor protein 6